MPDHQVSFALGALVVLLPAAAAAQETQPAPKEVEEVVITGSRIVRQDYSANTPIVTLGAETVEKTGTVTLDTVLKLQPQFVASTGSTTNSSGNQGQANIQLRGLGRQRTLVLMDGRRLPPANSDGSPDINAVPTALIQNVEVITGGASAVYGSDAIAGVVNIKMRHKFDGLEVSGQYGVSGHGDAEDYKVSVAGGGRLASDRGSAVFSLEYANRSKIFLSDRDWTNGSQRDSVLPFGLVTLASNAPPQSAIDQVFARYGVAPGTVRAGNQFGFNADGTLFSTGLTVQNYKGATDPTLYAVTPTQVLAEGRQYRFLQLPLERYSVYSRFDYELTPSVSSFAQFMFTHSVASTQLNPVPAGSSATTGVPLVPVTNPFVPNDLRKLLAARPDPNTPIALSKQMTLFGPRLQEGRNNTFQVVLGLDGKLAISDWKWDLSATYGKNSILVVRPNWQSRSALATLFNAPDGGASICSGGFNPFGDRPTSAACAAFINKRLKSNSEVEQRIVEANLQGKLFDAWAGPVRFAVGADYREDHFVSEADPLIVAGDILAGNGSDFSGRTVVKELYGELLIPIFKDLLFTKDLNLDVAGRVSDYDTIGRVETYKADFNWKLIESVSLRGGYERAIRAPNIGELNAPRVNGTTIIGVAGNLGSGDPCDVRGAYRHGANAALVRSLCLAQGMPTGVVDTFTSSQQSISVLSGGNPNLKAETADTFSAGLVWKSPFSNPLLSNLSASIDYYNIEVTDAVGSITAPLVLSRCFNADGRSNPTYGASNPFCGLVQRSAEGNLLQVSQQLLNLGGYKTSGIDFQADWRLDAEALGLKDGGAVSIHLVSTYLDKFQIRSLPNDPFLDYAGTIGNGQVDPVAISRPKWKSILEVTYQRDRLELGATWRYFGKMSNSANVGTSGTAAGAPSMSYFDLNARYRLSEKLELWAVANNIADKDPPAFPSVGSTDLATYDAIGRRFTVGVKARF
jgi:iron complex outermembrane recepter protein